MDVELILAVISRWMHVGIAIVLVGGTAFFRLVVMPALGDDHTELIEKIRERWKKFVHAGIGMFIVSGVINYILLMQNHKGDKLWSALVGVKMALALVVFFLASALVGSKPGTQKFRDNSKKWTSVMLLISAVIVGISGIVKVRRPYEAPAAEESADSQPSE